MKMIIIVKQHCVYNNIFVAASQYLSPKYNNQKVWTDVNALMFNQPKVPQLIEH